VKYLIIILVLVLGGCAKYEPPCGLKEGQWVKHLPTGDVGQVDIYDFYHVKIKLSSGQWFSVNCADVRIVDVEP
jgi:hypothetical protein